MSDHIEVNGKTYYASWYLELANQNSRRRSERVVELERQVEALTAAIRKVIEGNVQETVGPSLWKNKVCKHGNYVDQGCKWCIRDCLQSALDAVEKPETRVPEFIERGADEQT